MRDADVAVASAYDELTLRQVRRPSVPLNGAATWRLMLMMVGPTHTGVHAAGGAVPAGGQGRRGVQGL